MREKYENWEKDDFKAFLMIHLANADLDVSQDELIAIMDNIDEITYKKVKRLWDSCNDYECLQIISKMRQKHFPGEAGKEELINSMVAFAQLDEMVSTNERVLIAALRKLL
jgi:hypothetical protein